MPQNSFRNIGLRRDENFGDLENRETGLTNLLNDFASGSDSYIGDDLNEAIRSIRSYPVTKSEINALAGITFKNTFFDVETNSPVTQPAVPLVTVKNQFDRVKLELGEQSYFAGNVTGINAKFFNTSQLNVPTNGAPDPATLFTGDPVIEKPFWTEGLFDFPNKFNSALDNQQGGVQWDGYITPEANGDITFNIEQSCNLLLNLKGETALHLANAVHTVSVVAPSNPDAAWTLANYSDHRFIAGGCLLAIGNRNIKITNISLFGEQVILSVSGSDQFASDGATYQATVHTRYQEWTTVGGDFRFYPIADDTSYPDQAPGDATNISYIEPGASTYTSTTRLRGIEEYEPLQFTASIWLPESHMARKKQFEISATMLLLTVPNQYYYNFSNTIPSSDPADFPEFKKFYANRLLQDGGKIGSSVSPQSIKTNKSITSTDYVPPDWDAILNQGQDTVVMSAVAGTNIVSEVLDSPLYAEVGNIFLKSDGTITKVVKVIPGVGLIFDSPPVPSGGNFDLRLINHRGFVKVTNSWSYTVSTNASTITVDSTSELIPGMIFVYNGGKEEITKIISATSFEVGGEITNTDAINHTAYVYLDAGVLNYTTYNVVTVTDASTLVLDTVFGIQPGYYIKSVGKAGTLHLQEVDTVNTNTNTITTVVPTTGDIASGDRLIAERANVNTAPPFIATLTGLSTGGSNIKLTNPSGLLRAFNIEVKNYIDETTEFTAANDSNYYRLVDVNISNDISQPSVPYKLIASSFDNPENP